MQFVGKHYWRHSILLAGLAGAGCFRIIAAPTKSQSQGAVSGGTAEAAIPAPTLELPKGEGKVVAIQYCQACHRLSNLTTAHKSLDDWKDTIQTMIDRGAAIPDDKIEILAKYLTANFGPKDAGSGANAVEAPAGTPPAAAASGTSATEKAVELPDGDGKAIAIENCQVCHKLTNLTKVHKSLDDWKDTVQIMIDRGASIPGDQVDILVRYLAKNFGPTDVSVPASAVPKSSTPAQ